MNLSRLIDALDLSTAATGEEGACSSPAGDEEVEEARYENRPEEVEYETLRRLQRENAGCEAEEEGS